MQNNSVFEKGNCSSTKSSAFSVLVVDDDSLIRKLSKMILSMKGMEVQVAENGKEAVDLHLAGASFNLILMDMEMPVMNGPQATKELRKMGIDIPIVGVTGHRPGPELNAFVAAGLSECVQKPLTINKIAAYLPFCRQFLPILKNLQKVRCLCNKVISYELGIVVPTIVSAAEKSLRVVFMEEVMERAWNKDCGSDVVIWLLLVLTRVHALS